MKYDSTALGSDIARNKKQARARVIANFVVANSNTSISFKGTKKANG